MNTKQNDNNELTLHVDFGGFYDSIHSSQIEHLIESMTDEDEDINADLIYDNIDLKATQKTYAESYTNLLNNAFDLDLKFKGLWSPKFYNFETDNLILLINEADQKELLDTIESSSFANYVDGRLKSRDGFSSFYDNGAERPYDTITERAETSDADKSNLYAMALEYLIDEDNINDEIYDVEFELIELN